MTSFPLITSGLRRRRLRTLITRLSIAVVTGVSTVSFLATARIGVFARGADQPRLYVVPAATNGSLPMRYLARVAEIAGTKEPLVWQHAYGVTRPNNRGQMRHSVWGVSEGFPATYSPHIWKLTPEVQQAWIADPRAVIMPSDIAEYAGYRLGQEITVELKFGDVPGRVVGIMPGTGPGILMHGEYLDAFPDNSEAGVVSRIVVPCARDRFGPMIRAIDAAFIDEAEPTLTMPELAYHEAYLRLISFMPNLLAGVSIAMIALTVLLTTSTLSMSVRERHRELAALRALGFSRRRLAAHVLIESVVLCVPAAAVGVLALVAYYHHRWVDIGPFHLKIGLLEALRAIGWSAAWGAAIGVVPALGAARIPVVEALNG